MSIDELLSLMPPHSGAGADIDWDTTESAWGFRFPADYKEFVRHYGAGSIENFLAVFEPALGASERPEGAMADETAVAQELWEELEGIQGVDADPERILAWAVNGTADMLCWLRAEGSPDAWPVLVYERDKDAWRLYDCGMVEFLLRAFREEDPGHPLSGTPMWGASSPRFLTRRERRRIADAGRDPWA
ncbi:SMI1/KNR4 family protein [Streptomyces sp. NPDC096079]|uniref:SMI1/KNR4 family protein n=1 Tax=unclassified Streptomyces TaxID=2593676 RepID=UPI00331C6EEB